MPLVVGILAGAAAAATALGYLVAYRRENRPDRILGLLYHRIVSDEEYATCPPTEKLFSMPERRFREQLLYLRSQGYSAVALDQVVAYVRGGPALPPRPVLVTFDDGSVSVHHAALPVLRELGWPATLFVTTDPAAWVFALGSRPQRRVTPEEIRELDQGGVTIGSHSVTHGALESMSADEIAFELGESKRHLESVLGHEVKYFGVPLNWYGPKVRRAAESLGYAAVCTSDNGTIHRDSDPFHLRRFIIEGTFDLSEFARNLGAHAIVQRRCINTIKRVPARLLGPRLWLPFRRWLFSTFLGRYFALRYFKRALATTFVLAALAVLFFVWWLADA
jgi:peptidoglycan/xylan/chitin deacetylase (PgdA/CDA1 family)